MMLIIFCVTFLSIPAAFSAHLYEPAALAAQAMAKLEKREEIEALISQDLPQFPESSRQVVLNFWLECVLSRSRFEGRERLLAEILLEHGADINARSQEIHDSSFGSSISHATLLQESVLLGRLKAVEFLLEHGADLLKLNIYTGQSALHIAAGKCGEKKACTLIGLLAEKIPIDYLSDEPDPRCAKNWWYAGETPLWTALRERVLQPKVVQKLLKRGAQPNYPHPVLAELPLDYILKMLHTARSDLNFMYNTHTPEQRKSAYYINKEKPAKKKEQKLHDIAQTLYCFGAGSVLLSGEIREEFERAREQFLLNDDYLEYKYDLFGAEQEEKELANNNAQDGCIIL